MKNDELRQIVEMYADEGEGVHGKVVAEWFVAEGILVVLRSLWAAAVWDVHADATRYRVCNNTDPRIETYIWANDADLRVHFVEMAIVGGSFDAVLKYIRANLKPYYAPKISFFLKPATVARRAPRVG